MENMNRWKAFLEVASSGLQDVVRSLKRQYLSRGYLVAIAVFGLAVLFSVLTFSPILSSFIYPLF